MTSFDSSIEGYRKKVLRSSALLATLDASVSDNELDRLLSSGHSVTFSKGDVILQRQHTSQPAVTNTLATFSAATSAAASQPPDRYLYIIEDGEAAITLSHHDSPPVRVGSVHSSDIVGDAALYTDHSPSATITAETDVHAYAIGISAILKFISSHPEVSENLEKRRWLWATLSKIPHFRGLNDDLKKEELLAHFRERIRNDGEVVVAYGDPGDTFYLVEEGQCNVLVPPASVLPSSQAHGSVNDNSSKSTTPTTLKHPQPSSHSASTAISDNNNGSNVLVATKGPGDFFGELALLYNMPRQATVQCVSPVCKLWSVDAQSFRTACTEGNLYLKTVFFEHAQILDPSTGERYMNEANFLDAIKRTQAKRLKDDKKKQSSDQITHPRGRLSEQQLRMMFRMADSSGDNLISFSEFVQLNYLMKGPYNKYQIAFRMFDKDKSGTIDRDEFIAAMRSLAKDPNELIDLHNDKFIRDMFGDESSHRRLNYSQFEQLLERDELPSFLHSLRSDLRTIQEELTRAHTAWSMLDGTSSVVAAATSKSGITWSWKSLVAGGIAGAISRTVVSPLERLKLLFQMQGQPPKYTSMAQALKLIYREDGIYGFFRGNLSNVIRITPTSAFQFFFYDLYKRLFFPNKTQAELSAVERLWAGGNAGYYPFHILTSISR